MGGTQSVGSFVSSQLWNSSRKRDRSSLEASCEDRDDERVQESSWNFGKKRKRLMTTTKYIYRALFEEGQNSDVTLIMLDKAWKLHKFYLCQSPFFAKLFAEEWKDYQPGATFHVQNLDETVNLDSLKIVLGSLYLDELEIKAEQVESVIAAASMLHLDSVIKKCAEIMVETLSFKTVFTYHEVSERYGGKIAEEACIKWLLTHLLLCVNDKSIANLPSVIGDVSGLPGCLRKVSANLMGSLISSGNLVVVGVESTIYKLLRMWLFLVLHPTWSGTRERADYEAQRYFRTAAADTNDEFLSTSKGRQYAIAFRGLRLQYLLTITGDMEMVLSDRIIPAKSFDPIFRIQWYKLLRVEEDADRGPYQVSEQQFNQTSRRCGHVITSDGPTTWRFKGFHFGLDLVFIYDHGTLRVRRDHLEQKASLTQQVNRNIAYRISVYGLDERNHMKLNETTGIQYVELHKNEEARLMTMKRSLYPMVLTANFLVVVP